MKLLLFILWRRERTKRHPPPPSRPLYWADVTQEIAETVDFLPCRKAGTRLVFLRLASSNKRQSRAFIGWRMEKELDLNNRISYDMVMLQSKENRGIVEFLFSVGQDLV